MTSHYTDNISETGGGTNSVSVCRTRSFLLSSAQGGGEGESLPNYGDELVFKPSEQRVFVPAQTAAPILGSKPRFKNPFLYMMSVS